MKIAIMGIRGIPACYGGFETLAEELAPRLVKRGHEVTVYGRSNIIDYIKEYYKGVRIRLFPTINHKYLDTVFHSFLCVLDSLFQKYELIFICNAANSIFAFLPRLTGKRVVVNVDGIERRRKKWSPPGKLWYLLGEIFSVLFPNEIVADAGVIQGYYKKRYHKDSVLIPYGASLEKVPSTNALEKFGVRPKKYFLYVSRLEPENNAHIVIKAFEGLRTDKSLVIVGDAPYSKGYISSLRKTSDPRVIFTGYVFGEGYREFLSHAYGYVHATEVGGTHPALIEAMGAGNCVIANDTPENKEVLQDAGMIYAKNDIADLQKNMQLLEDHPEMIVQWEQKARRRVAQEYNWDSVVEKYETLFYKLI